MTFRKSVLRIIIPAICLGTFILYESFKEKETIPNNKLKFIGECIVPNNKIYGGTLIGGLSGIDYDPKTNSYYIISDDRSEHNPTRFYTAKLFFSDRSFDSIRFTGVRFIKQPDGTFFPSKEKDKHHVPDPESIRYIKRSNTLLWSSEGERKFKKNDTVLIDPFLREMDSTGAFIKEYKLPSIFKMNTLETGPRLNGVFEGIALSPDEKFIYLSLEEPLFQDGPRADIDETKSYIRILKINRNKNKVVAQYAYKLDRIHASPFPPVGFKINGVDEILGVAKDKLYVMERSFALGSFPPNSVKIYEADLKTGSNVNSLNALQNTNIKPVIKKLIIDLKDIPVSIDNVEGITFGPRLPNGHQSLILVSDNNFDPIQKTQFLAFEVLE